MAASDMMGGFMQSNPYSAGIAAAGQVATKALEKGTVTNGVTTGDGVFDHSGWSVNFGSGSIERNSTAVPSQMMAQAAGLLNNPLVLGAILLGLYLYLKK